MHAKVYDRTGQPVVYRSLARTSDEMAFTNLFYFVADRSFTADGVSGKVSSEGPVGGVAQVVCHGVKVVGVHGEEGQEKDGEVRGKVKGEVEQLRDNRTCAWREDGMTDSRDDLSQCGCDK